MIKYISGLAVILIITFGFVLIKENKINKPQTPDSGLKPAESFSHSHGLAVDIEDSTKVYIATHEGTYLLHNDKDLYRVGKTRDDLMGFTTHPKIPGIFFSSGHPARGGNIGFQKSEDGGLTWQKVSSGIGGPVDFHSLALSTANPNIAYGFYNGRLERSLDQGKTWEYAKGVIKPFALSAHPKKENTIYAATEDGVKISEDGGDAWQDLSKDLLGGAVSVFSLNPSQPEHALAFSQKLRGLAKSSDGGATFAKIEETFSGETVMYLSFSSSQPNIVYALTHANSIYKSEDGGDTWKKVR